MQGGQIPYDQHANMAVRPQMMAQQGMPTAQGQAILPVSVVAVVMAQPVSDAPLHIAV